MENFFNEANVEEKLEGHNSIVKHLLSKKQ